MVTPIKDTLSHYRILRELGSGGMGVVYLAQDMRLDRCVAIKVLADELNRDPSAKSRFFREARAISGVDHPNICSVHEIDETPDGRIFIVMSHYEGTTLDRLMISGPLPVREALDIVTQVAQGLAKAHARGVVHRDIKPTNVMSTEDGVIKILDFGVAHVAGASTITTTGQMLGTPAYMAPEQWRGEEVGPPADIWAVGVLLFGLLAGRIPFENQHRAAMMYAVLNRQPDPLMSVAPNVPHEVDLLVRRCLEKDPAKRFANGAELLSALNEVTARVGLERPITPDTGRSFLRRRPSKRRIAAYFATPLVALGLWWGGSQWLKEKQPLRVAVLPPEISSLTDSTEIRIASATIQSALMRGLAGFKGVTVLDPSELRNVTGGNAVIASTVAVDEVTKALLDASPEEWHVRLRWVTANDIVRWSDEFSVPRGNPVILANAIIARLPRAYPRKALRPGAQPIRVRPEDYVTFLNLFPYQLANPSQLAERAKALDALHRKSPAFLDAHLLDARFSLYAYEVSRDSSFVGRANRASERALAFDPEDPRSLEIAILVAIARHDLREAERRLSAFLEQDPGNPQVEYYAAILAEKTGHATEAMERMAKLVERRSSKFYLQQLAELEYRNGFIAPARRNLDQLIRRFPQDPFAHSKLGQLELLYGSPERADSIYGEALRRTPRSPTLLNNRGLARLLLRRYEAALADFRQAHSENPKKLVYLLNVADCEALMGRADSARASYSRVIQQGRGDRSASALLWRAQCLAHLGRGQEAVAAVQEGLRMQPEDSEALYQASLVYALVGDHESALVNARKAIDKGVELRWFGLVWFDPLRSDTRFQRILQTKTRT